MIGENIRYYRKTLGLTQDDLGHKLRVDRATISSWEINRTEPSMGMIEAMSKIFGCTKSELIDGISSYLPQRPENKPFPTQPVQNVFSDLTEEERIFINAYRESSPTGRYEALMALLKGKVM